MTTSRSRIDDRHRPHRASAGSLARPMVAGRLRGTDPARAAL
ncbi:hypothetical protein OG725_32810 [Streptomyces sp. NBC_01213]|nr:hypothetical protein OG725_32810 [Streptomyces sp. NBC_01213]